MMQIIKCECGADTMLNGRCVGCKRVRPSSDEVKERLKSLQQDIDAAHYDLELAEKLEREDKNGTRTIQSDT